jgi:hypothetical protein
MHISHKHQKEEKNCMLMKITRNPFVPVKLSRATQQQVFIHESGQTTTSKVSFVGDLYAYIKILLPYGRAQFYVICIPSLCHLLISLILNPSCSSILPTFICDRLLFLFLCSCDCYHQLAINILHGRIFGDFHIYTWDIT